MAGRRPLRIILDLMGEAASATDSNRLASLVLTMGMALGAAVFVGVTSISTTLSSQVSDLFDERLATTITAESRTSEPWITESGLESVRRLVGVDAVGILGNRVETTVGVRHTTATRFAGARLASPEALRVIEPHMVAGVAYRRAHELVGVPVALIPSSLIETVGLSGIGQQIVVGEGRYRVVGVFDGLERRLDAAGDILVIGGAGSAARTPEAVVIKVAPGWGTRVAPVVAVALRPDDPGQVVVSSPLDPEDFRLSVEESVRATGLAVSIVAMVVSGLMLAVVTASGVVSRYSEIGMRRALGTPRTAIALELMIHSVLVGLRGALIGVSVGVVGVTLWAERNGHRAMFDLAGLGKVWLVSILVGLVAGLVPAVVALRVPPVTALRS